MSVGVGGFCSKYLEDDNEIVYTYSSYNLNIPDYRNMERTEDGVIAINKFSLVEPEIHEKIKKTSKGKKLFVKRIPHDIQLSVLLNNGKVKIENCTNTWELLDGYDKIALSLCRKLFIDYQLYGKLPDKLSYDI